MQPIRRLLSATDLGQKLGFTTDWVIRNWNKLISEKDFPPPVLGGGIGNHLRWDEKAVDLWLDSLLPEPFKNQAAADTQKYDPAEQLQTQSRLHSRAQELAL
ncbi:MAG: hypothetical protein IAE63_04170 [Alphaproteobacteria bacterium]|nr:hypothetical protein [Alphaproteobacteria bacterium]